VDYLRPVDQSGECTEGREFFKCALLVRLGTCVCGQISDELGASHTEELRTVMLASPVRGWVRVVVQPKPWLARLWWVGRERLANTILCGRRSGTPSFAGRCWSNKALAAAWTASRR
jgi:hypothetical protein